MVSIKYHKIDDPSIKHFNDAVKNKRGVQITFSKAAIANMIKSGGIFPLLAAIPAIIAAAAPAVAKAAALGVVGTAAGMALKKASGQGYKKGKESKTTRNPPFVVQRERLKDIRYGLLVEKPVVGESMTPMSNFYLIDAAKALSIKKTSELSL